MSELAGQTSLEPDKTTTPPTETPEPEGTEQVGDKRMVPVSALIEERRERQAAKAERDALAAEATELRKIKENWAIVEPYLPLLATHPKVTGKPAPAAPSNTPDPELVQIAETFGFYDANGEIDLKRAAGAKTYMDTRVKSTAEEMVKPIAHTAATTQARMLRERAYTVVDKQGRQFANRANIDRVLDALPPDQQADPAIVSSALLIARGMEDRPAGEPTHTEGAGGRPGGPTALSAIERAAMRARGMTEADFVKMRDTDSNVLE